MAIIHKLKYKPQLYNIMSYGYYLL